MCGIAGIVDLGGLDPEVLVSMTHLVKHRGPDGFGFAYYRPGAEIRPEIIHNENRRPLCPRAVVGLGNRRLAILDLSEMGNMPMQTEDGSCCITYNGEIYNYCEIRSELEAAGYRFLTKTDTEVLLKAYQHWGEDCLHRFNGMWAFALWDQLKRTLFCARDRFGVKPFYYSLIGGRFFFGSEIKQLIHGAKLPKIANDSVVYHFLEQCLVDYSADTFFENIFQLPGGHALTLRLTDCLHVSVRRYWGLTVHPEKKASEDDERVCEEFQERWETAVRLRLRSDVPVGCSLSGGVDSSAVICQAKKLAPSLHFHTFSSCVDEESMDERRFIRAVGKAINSSEHLVFPHSTTFWETVNSIAYYQDEPLQSGGVYAQWCVMAEAHKHGVPVLMGGQGGDESLCGYQKYRYFYLWQLLREGDPKVLREALLTFRNGTRSSWALSDASRYFPALLRPSFSVVGHLGSSELRDSSAHEAIEIGAMGSIAERQKLDLTLASIPSLLHLEDRNAMAHSVETRLPFLDYKLVEFAVNCPTSFKLRDGWNKWILRRAMKGILPEVIRLRKSKLAFTVPQKRWMLEGLRNGHRDIWESRTLRMARFLDSRRLAEEIRRFLNSERGALAPDPLFRAISLELWARVHNAC